MHYLWNGKWPANCSPKVGGAWLAGKTAQQNVRLKSGQSYPATINATDPDHDPLRYRWEVMEESTDLKTGGDAESQPKTWPGLINGDDRSGVTLRAPDRPGAYRLFIYVFDGKGHAGHVNIPFYVEP
jgi:hypothetical protein